MECPGCGQIQTLLCLLSGVGSKELNKRVRIHSWPLLFREEIFRWTTGGISKSEFGEVRDWWVSWRRIGGFFFLWKGHGLVAFFHSLYSASGYGLGWEVLGCSWILLRSHVSGAAWIVCVWYWRGDAVTINISCGITASELCFTKAEAGKKVCYRGQLFMRPVGWDRKRVATLDSSWGPAPEEASKEMWLLLWWQQAKEMLWISYFDRSSYFLTDPAATSPQAGVATRGQLLYWQLFFLIGYFKYLHFKCYPLPGFPSGTLLSHASVRMLSLPSMHSQLTAMEVEGERDWEEEKGGQDQVWEETGMVYRGA